MSGIGTCERPLKAGHPDQGACGAALCVSGREVVCESCGTPAGPEHPLMKEWEAAPKSLPRDFVIPPQHYASTQGDRLILAEKAVAGLILQAGKLEARLAAAEAQLQQQAGKRKG